MRKIYLFSIFILLTLPVLSATFTAVGSGNWSSSTTWSPVGIPSVGDIVRIDKSYSVTVNQNVTVASIQIYNSCVLSCGSGTTGFTIESGVTLTVTGNADFSPVLSAWPLTLTNNGALVVNGILTMNTSSAKINCTNTGSISTGSFSSSGADSLNISGAGTFSVNTTFTCSSKLTMTISSSLSIGGTCTITSSYIQRITNNGSFTAGNLTMSGSSGITFTGSGNYTVSGALSTSSKFTMTVNGSLSAGSFSNTGSNLCTITGSGTYALNGAVSLGGRIAWTLTRNITPSSFSTSGSNLMSLSGEGSVLCAGPVSLAGYLDWDLRGVLSGTTLSMSSGTGFNLYGTGSLQFSQGVTMSVADDALILDLVKLSAASLTVTNSTSQNLSLELDSLVLSGNLSLIGDFASNNYYVFDYLQLGGDWSISNASNPGVNDLELGNCVVGGSLTVSSNWPSAKNTLRFNGVSSISGNLSLSTDRTSTDGQNELDIYGTLNIAGSTGLSMNYTSSSFNSYKAPNQVILGSSSSSGLLNISSGKLSMQSVMSSTFDSRLDTVNLVNLIQGSLVIADSIMMSSTAHANNNLILASDNSSADGKAKSLYLGGSVNNVTQGMLKINDTNGNMLFTSYFNGVGKKQSIPCHNNWNFRRIEVTNVSDTVRLSDTLSAVGSRLTGRLKVNTGAWLHDNGYRYGGTGADSIALDSGAQFIIAALNDQFPQLIEHVSTANGGIVKFYNNSGSTQLALGGSGTVKTMASVYMSGSGVKQIMAPLSATNLAIQYLKLESGITTLNSAATTLNTVSGSQLNNQLIELSAGATLQFPQDLSQSPQSKFTFAYTSTVQYSGANQSIYRMHSSAPNSGALAALGNLSLSGSGTKTLSDSLKMYRKLSISGTSLTLASGSSLSLLSDATYTAWVGAITSSSIIYQGSGSSKGKMIAQRYVSLPGAGYRDYSSPVKNTTLQSWKDKGILFTGFSGSNYPSYSFNNTYKYTESADGELNTGWTSAQNITEAVHALDGGALLNGGWRIYTGKSSGTLAFTLADEGEVYAGDVTLKLNFTHNSASRIVDDGWNFVGNPYPSAIDWSAVYAANVGGVFAGDSTSNGVAPSVYMYMPSDRNNPGGALNYGAFNVVTGSKVGVSSNVIPAYQGFWLKTYHASANSQSYHVTLRESEKYDGAGTIYKSGENKVDMASVVCTDPVGKKDEVGLHYYKGAGLGWDLVYDIQKFEPEVGVSSLYFACSDSIGLWVNAIPANKREFELELVLHAGKTGVYNLDFSSLLDYFGNLTCIKVIDSKIGQEISLDSASAVMLISATQNEKRLFKLQFKTGVSYEIEDLVSPLCFGFSDGKAVVNQASNGALLSSRLEKVDANTQTRMGTFSGAKISLNDLSAGEYRLYDEAYNSCGHEYISFTLVDPEKVRAKYHLPSFMVYTGQDVQFTNQSTGASAFEWSFEDDLSQSEESEPVHRFTSPGIYKVKLKASNGVAECDNTFERSILVESGTGIEQNELTTGALIQSNDKGIEVHWQGEGYVSMSVYGLDGRLVLQKNFGPGRNIINTEYSGVVAVILEKEGQLVQARRINLSVR